MLRSSSFRLTGKFLNMSSTVTVVPFVAATTVLDLSFPDISKSSLVPFAPSFA
jgi:hypothetical protein